MKVNVLSAANSPIMKKNVNSVNHKANISFGSDEFILKNDNEIKPEKNTFLENVKNLLIPKENHTKIFNTKVITTPYRELPSITISSIKTGTMRRLCREFRLNPAEDLFIVGGKEINNKKYVMFNIHTLAKDKDRVASIFYLESDDDKLTDIQKDALKLYADEGYNTKFFYNTPSPLDILGDRHFEFDEKKFIKTLGKLAKKSPVELDYEEMENSSRFAPYIERGCDYPKSLSIL